MQETPEKLKQATDFMGVVKQSGSLLLPCMMLWKSHPLAFHGQDDATAKAQHILTLQSNVTEVIEAAVRICHEEWCYSKKV